MNAEQHGLFLTWRNVETPCTKCHGTGGRVYGSTATWRGGLGGAAMTHAVCDHCWGSGDEHEHWADLRRAQSEFNGKVATEAARIFTRRLAGDIASMGPALEAIAAELDRLSRGRKERPRFFDTACIGLARLLREMTPRQPEQPKPSIVE